MNKTETTECLTALQRALAQRREDPRAGYSRNEVYLPLTALSATPRTKETGKVIDAVATAFNNEIADDNLTTVQNWTRDNTFSAGQTDGEKAPLVERAISIARSVHQGQRHGQNPYTHHTEAVAASVITRWDSSRHGPLSENTVAAALLHDSLEDQPMRLIDLADGLPIDTTEQKIIEQVKLEPHLTQWQTLLESDPKAFRKELGLAHREIAAVALVEMTNPDTVALVHTLTNPATGDYQTHLENKIFPVEETLARHGVNTYRPVAAIKASDMISNAGSVHLLDDERKQIKLAGKYTAPTRDAARSLSAMGMDTFAQPLREASTRCKDITLRHQMDQLTQNIRPVEPENNTHRHSAPA